MAISTGTTGTVCATPTTAATEASVEVTFPTGYTLGAASAFTVNTTDTAWPAGAAAWPSIDTASGVSSQTVTFPSGDLTVGTLYCFNWDDDSAVTTKSSATDTNTGSVTTRDGSSAAIDDAAFSTATISNDQIVVTATVPQSFSFALSGNTDDLGTLTLGSVKSSPTPRTATINTNAKNGWMLWGRDLNTGLSSASAAASIGSTTPGSNSTLSPGTEGYNTGITHSEEDGAGTVTVEAPFVGGSTGKGGGLDTTLRVLTSSDGPNKNAVATITNNVTIDSLTPAATDYTDTITLVAAGLF
jgi:hypothetical protein